MHTLELSVTICVYTDILVDDLLVTAHEMGHALSARHDGEYNNTCSGTDAYIMSSSYSAHHSVSITNYFLFSNCSIRYFQTFLDRVLAAGDTTSRSCLLESLEPASVTNVTGEWPGQLYNVNEQCQMKYGPTSYMCLGVNSSVSVCKRLYCSLPDRPGFCRSINAVDGTTCGNRQWCVSGECVSSVDAPEQDQNCPYGDRIETCGRDIPAHRKNLCYTENNYNLCCETCTSYKEDVENCTYGDRIDTCATDIPPHGKNLCYIENNYNLCCETCASYKGDEGCEYGDDERNRLCSLERCDPSDITYINTCCATCSILIPTTSTLTSTPTSTTTTSTPTSTSTTSTPTSTPTTSTPASTSTSTSTTTTSTPTSTSTTSTPTSTPTTSAPASTSTSTTTTSTPTPTPTTSTPTPTSTATTSIPTPTSTSTTSTPTSTTSTSTSTSTSTTTTSTRTTTSPSTTSSTVPTSTAYTTTPVTETPTSSSGLATHGKMAEVGGLAVLLSLLAISL